MYNTLRCANCSVIQWGLYKCILHSTQIHYNIPSVQYRLGVYHTHILHGISHTNTLQWLHHTIHPMYTTICPVYNTDDEVSTVHSVLHGTFYPNALHYALHSMHCNTFSVCTVQTMRCVQCTVSFLQGTSHSDTLHYSLHKRHYYMFRVEYRR